MTILSNKDDVYLFVLKQIAINTHCSAMQFLVVIWNQDSVEYYSRLGALDLSCEEGWHLFRFNIKDLLELAEEEWKHLVTTHPNIGLNIWMSP